MPKLKKDEFNTLLDNIHAIFLNPESRLGYFYYYSIQGDTFKTEKVLLRDYKPLKTLLEKAILESIEIEE